ncbi:hypothetical protein [Puniceibacterium sediminis]|uniref:Uncharacterized protein n=1 Tax=Puniceibacterium sediminis TaxID=1608407 RepID=A0A238WCX9_9RHOB|nr:hypothetical protein [Puniceibacterium sediminis]SNR44422.1 hypothetical protein SAMN06265370_105115 [Puniceibacterium sediminis]
MTTYRVEPVPGYEDEVIVLFCGLPLKCADGFDSLLDVFAEREPGILYRCGLLADRYEVYAIDLPDCPELKMILSIDRREPSQPRVVPTSDDSCNQGASLAIRQFGLINPSWET